jgi:hypothetical protein
MAMDLLHAGVEQTAIALWLGHELCLFRAVTMGMMSLQHVWGFLGN